MRRKIIDANYSVNNVTGTTNSDPIDLSNGELFSIQSIIDVNTPAAVTFDSNTYELDTVTFTNKAGTAHQDFIKVFDAAGLSYAIALTKPVAAIDTLTFPSFAGAADGDYVVFTDGSGLSWAVALDKTGLAANTPTGAAWVAVAAGRRVYVDVSLAVTATNVCDAVRTALNALTGFTAAVTLSGTATVVATMVVKAPVTAPAVHNKDDSGAGSITATNGTAGVQSVAPSGAIWLAIASARRGIADISSDSTAAQVAARAETAFNLLTGFTAAITTDDTAADGTMKFTQTAFGPVSDFVPKNGAESTAGTITVAETTPGYSTELDLTANTASIPSHGLPTGLKGQLTTTGTLPTGVTTSTDYFIIATSSTLVKFASSLANALLGTAIDLTGEGNGRHTFTPTSLAGATVTLQKSNNYGRVGVTAVWDAVASATSITVDADVWFEVANPGYSYARLQYTLTAGSLSSDNYVIVKG